MAKTDSLTVKMNNPLVGTAHSTNEYSMLLSGLSCRRSEAEYK